MTTTATRKRAPKEAKVTDEFSHAPTWLPGTAIYSEWVHVTAKLAAEWLEANAGNRHLDPGHVARLVEDMSADRWLVTHQGIAFDDKGILRDGQHRLTAQVRLGVDRWWLVTRGLPAKAQTEMDSGKKRQVLDFMQGKNKAIRAAGARIYLSFREAQPNVTENAVHQALTKMTTARVLTAFEQDTYPMEKLLALSDEAARAGKATQVVTGSALLGAAAFTMDTPEALEFLRGFHQLTGLPNGDPRIALLKLRGRPGQRIHRQDLAVMALRVAVAYRDGTTIRVLKPAYTQQVEAREFGSDTGGERMGQTRLDV